MALLRLILTTHSQNTKNRLIRMHVCNATDQFSMQLYLPDIFCVLVSLLALKQRHWYFIAEVEPYRRRTVLCDKPLSSETYYFKNHGQVLCTVISCP